MLDAIRDWLDNLWVQFGEHANAQVDPASHARSYATDPEYRRAADEWAAYVQQVRERQRRRGMLPMPGVNGTPVPNPNPVPTSWPGAGGVRG